MQVITKNAEELLFQDLKHCWETAPTNRCLHVRFGTIDETNREDCIATLLELLESKLDPNSLKVFICHDRDVFVLTRYVTQKRVDEILAHLPPKLPPAQTNGLAALFEIGVDWSRLREICARKVESKRELANRKAGSQKTEEVEGVNRDTVLQKIDRDLLSSLAMRRAERRHIEIMVVEDDPFTQKLINNALQKDYALTISKDGQGAILNYVNKAPDVLFLDIGLPDMSGHEVLERLFALDPDAYVVMFSGNGDKENVLRAINLGAKGFVGKPFTHEKLMHYIEKSPYTLRKSKKETIHGHIIH